MKNKFDKVYTRRGTGAIKTDCLMNKYGRDDLLALWIADMDFKSPDAVRKALEKRLEQQIYGYTGVSEHYWQSIVEWENDINEWKITRDEITFIPGIVKGISFVIQCFSKPGDKILVQPPVYMPFMDLVKNNGRKVVFSNLEFRDGRYEMDFDDFEKVCKEEKPAVFILCNPQNPSGRVWEKEELAKVAEICCRYHVLVVSDEIHGDMPLFGSRYTPFPLASTDASDNSIIFKSPSKTFNIAGFMSSFCHVKNPEIRKAFFGYLKANELDSPDFMASVAAEAAYSGAREWRVEMLKYVEDNVKYAIDYLEAKIPGVSAVRPQASFLVWLDCSGLGLDHDDLIDLFINKAGLALNDGEDFGPGGKGFMRMNVGCPRSVLDEALKKLEYAVNELNDGK